MRHIRYRRVSCILVLLLGGLVGLPWALTGCSGCQKEEPAAPQAGPVAEIPAPPEAKAKDADDIVDPADAPVALRVLRVAPESSMITIAAPPPSGLCAKAMALAKRLAPAGVDLDALVAEQVAKTAAAAGVPDARTPDEVLRAKGIDPDAPIGLFMDPSHMPEELKKAVEAVKAARTAPEQPAMALDKAEEESAEPSAGKEKAASQNAEAPEPKPTAPPKPNPDAPLTPEEMDDVWSRMESAVRMTVLLKCADAAAAEAALKELLAAPGGPVDASKVEDIDADGFTIHSYDGGKLAYVVRKDKLLAGNSVPMLQETLERFRNPSAPRYGTAGMPASAPDEGVALVRMDKLMPLFKDLVPDLVAMSGQEGKNPFLDAQFRAMDEYVQAYRGEDPMVTTLSWTPSRIELLSRLDLATHPDFAEAMGEVKPLRLAAALPEGTALFLSVAINQKTKETIKKYATLPSQPGAGASANADMVMAITSQVLEMLGDEVALAIAGTSGGLPQVFLAANLANPDLVRGMLQTFGGLEMQEPYKDAQIGKLQAPGQVPVPLFAAFAGNTFLAGTDLAALKSLIDADKAGAPSALFASMRPPLDPALSRQSLLVLNAKGMADVVLPLLAFVPRGAEDAPAMCQKIASVLGSLRMAVEVQDQMWRGYTVLHLNEEAQP